MFACICHAVTEKDVGVAVAAGVDTVDELGNCTGAGTGCGTCRERLSGLIVRERANCPVLATLVA